MAKYKVIAEDLDQKIQEEKYTPGEVLPSEVKLAKEYGVNRMTLRKALDVLEDKGEIVRHRGRGTFVKSTGQRRTSGTLVYIGDTESHFYRDLYLAVCREAQVNGRAAVGYSPSHEEGELSESKHLQKLLDDATGVICDADHWSSIVPSLPDKLPVVRICKSHPNKPRKQDEGHGYVVAADNLRAGQYATQYLTDLGHQKIAYLCVREVDGGPYGLGRPHPMRAAYQGYQAGLKQAGIDQEYVIPFPPTCFQEGGQRALQSFLEQEDEMPTAFICDGDFRAAPLLRVMDGEGLTCPEDFSVVGLGNTPWCEMVSPSLTSVSFREKEMARIAVMLCQHDPADSVAVLQVRPTIIERASTKSLG